MAKNDFVPFATGGTANVIDQATWEGSTEVTNGMASGYAKSAYFNKAWRQGTFVASAISEWVNQELSTVPIPDDSNRQNWVNNFDAALAKRIGVFTGRTRLTGATNLYVDAALGNDANDGRSPSTAFKTIQHGINVVLSQLDIGPYNVYLQIAGGTYNESCMVGSNPLGMLGQGQWQFLTYNGQVVWNGSGYTLATSGGVQIVLNGNFLLSCAQAAVAPNGVIVPISGSRIGFVGSGLTFGNSPGCAHVYATTGGEFNNGSGNGAYTIAGGAATHWLVGGAGTITMLNNNVTLQGTPAFTNFAVAASAGTINCTGTTFLGTGATGGRYYANTNGIIYTTGGGPNFIPGSTPGAVATGGQYV